MARAFFPWLRFFINKQKQNENSLKLSADYCDTLRCFQLTVFGPVSNETNNVDPSCTETHFQLFSSPSHVVHIPPSSHRRILQII